LSISSSIIVAGQTKAGAGSIMGKVKRGRKAGSKNKKSPSWATQHEALSVRSDISTYEMWGKKIGVERVDEADQTRRQTVAFTMLAIRDREINAGGMVTTEAAENTCEHIALDPLRKAGVFDDPAEPRRAGWRVAAGVELLNLGLTGKVISRSTAAWRAVGGGGGGRISEADCESIVARAEMRYLRALDALGEHREMIRSVCVDMVVPTGTKRRQLLAGLDLLGEFLLDTPVPHDLVRPKLRVRDRRRMG
jgi:hypothetical protein